MKSTTNKTTSVEKRLLTLKVVHYERVERQREKVNTGAIIYLLLQMLHSCLNLRFCEQTMPTSQWLREAATVL